MLRNRQGFVFINISAIALLLAAVGLWYLHRAYAHGTLERDFGAMVTDGKNVMVNGETPTLGQPTETRLGIVKFYNQYINPAKQGAVATPISSAPAQGGYYGQ